MKCRVAFLLLLAVVLIQLPGKTPAAELKNLKGQTFSGDVVSISDKEIVFNAGGKMIKTALDQVLSLDMGPTTKIAADVPAQRIELVDGTLLFGKGFLIKKSQASITLLSTGKETPLSVAAINNVLNNIHDEKLLKQWSEAASFKRDRDQFMVFRDGSLSPLKGTIGEGNEEGTKITFALATDPNNKREVPVNGGAGMMFFRIPNPLAPPINVRVTDRSGNLFMVNALKSEGEELTLNLSCGLEFKLPIKDVAKLDFSKGRLTFLSDLTPDRKVLESASGPRFAHLIIDKNLNNTGPMRLKGEAFTKGMAVFTYTELEFHLKGAYNEFRAVAGIDDEVGGADGGVHLLIEGDGRELLSLTFNRQDKVKAQPITLNIKDVDKLRIVVSDPDGKDIGKHLNLGNAQVTK